MSTLQDESVPVAQMPARKSYRLALLALLFIVVGGWWGGSLVYHQWIFHPQGQIIFQCFNNLCSVNADGTQRRELTTFMAAHAAWSADGKRLAFDADGLSIMNIASQRVTHLTDAPATHPSWSPDGYKIAFIRYNPLNSNNNVEGLYVIDVDGTHEKRLTDSEADDPAWSPDGTKIAFSFYPGPNILIPRIAVIKSDGSGLTQLTNTASEFTGLVA